MPLGAILAIATALNLESGMEYHPANRRGMKTVEAAEFFSNIECGIPMAGQSYVSNIHLNLSEKTSFDFIYTRNPGLQGFE